MKVLLFGASGSGTTTLGKEIEKLTDFKHLDVDEYLLERDHPAFSRKNSFTRAK